MVRYIVLPSEDEKPGESSRIQFGLLKPNDTEKMVGEGDPFLQIYNVLVPFFVII